MSKLNADNEHIPAPDEREVVPPYDQGAEQSLLGTWLIDNKDHNNYLQFPVEAESFYFDEHVAIAQVVHDYVLLGKGTDPILVAAELKKRNKLESVGGLAYLKSLTTLVPTVQNIPYYGSIIKEAAMKRNIIRIARDAYEGGFNPAITVFELQQNIAKALDAIDQPAEISLSQVVANAIAEQTDEEKSSDHWPKSGISQLDNHLGGFKPGAVTIIAAFPGLGKSSIAGYCEYMAAKRGFPVCYITLEMSQSELINRCEAIEGVAPNKKMNLRQLTPLELKEYVKVGMEIISPLKMWFCDKVGNNPKNILTEIRRQSVVHKVKLFVIDYLQLVQPENGQQGNYNQFLSWFTAQLKNTARMLDCHIIEISQVSRDAFKDDRDLTMHDLRDSGSLEQNADNIILINNVEGHMGTEDDPTCLVTVNIAKQRSGDNNVRFALNFQKDFQQWSSPLDNVELPEIRTGHNRRKPPDEDRDLPFN
jgi:replicative DNA helicase